MKVIKSSDENKVDNETHALQSSSDAVGKMTPNRTQGNENSEITTNDPVLENQREDDGDSLIGSQHPGGDSTETSSLDADLSSNFAQLNSTSSPKAKSTHPLTPTVARRNRKRQELVFRFTIPSHVHSNLPRNRPENDNQKAMPKLPPFLVSAQRATVRIKYPEDQTYHSHQLAHVVLPLYYNEPLVEKIPVRQSPPANNTASSFVPANTIYAVHIPDDIPEGDEFYVTIDDHQYRLLRPYRQTNENTTLRIERSTGPRTMTSRNGNDDQNSKPSPPQRYTRYMITTSQLEHPHVGSIVYFSPPPTAETDKLRMGVQCQWELVETQATPELSNKNGQTATATNSSSTTTLELAITFPSCDCGVKSGRQPMLTALAHGIPAMVFYNGDAHDRSDDSSPNTDNADSSLTHIIPAKMRFQVPLPSQILTRELGTITAHQKRPPLNMEGMFDEGWHCVYHVDEAQFQWVYIDANQIIHHESWKQNRLKKHNGDKYTNHDIDGHHSQCKFYRHHEMMSTSTSSVRRRGYVSVLRSSWASSTTTTSDPSTVSDTKGNHDGTKPNKKSVTASPGSKAIKTSAAVFTTTTKQWLDFVPAYQVKIPTTVTSKDKRSLIGDYLPLCSYQDLWSVQVYLKKSHHYDQNSYNSNANKAGIHTSTFPTTTIAQKRTYLHKHLGVERLLQYQHQGEKYYDSPICVTLRRDPKHTLRDMIDALKNKMPIEQRDGPRKWKIIWRDSVHGDRDETDDDIHGVVNREVSHANRTGSDTNWYHAIVSLLLDPSNGLWKKIDVVQKRTQRQQAEDESYPPELTKHSVLDIAPLSYHDDTEYVLDCFWLLGRILAKALLEGRTVRPDFAATSTSDHISRTLAPYLYKHLLGWPITAEDLDIHCEQGLGQIPSNETTDDGDCVDHVDKALRSRFYESIQPQLTEFLSGFWAIIPMPFLTVIDGPEQLADLLNL